MEIKIARPEDADRISRLRIEAYHNGSKTKLSDYQFLKWNESDEKALIIYLETKSGEAISSIRINHTRDPRFLEELFDLRLQEPIEVPILLLDKLTTTPAYRGMGISSILRYHLLESASKSPLKSLAFTINEGVSRQALLSEIGFVFRKADLNHRKREVYKNESPVLLGLLNHLQFSTAVRVSKENLPSLASAILFKSENRHLLQSFIGSSLVEEEI